LIVIEGRFKTMTRIARVRVINVDQLIGIANKHWDEIRSELEKKFEERADALIEEARVRASIIVKQQLERDASELSDKLAKYIIALMLVERDEEAR